jgi:hypothetical protein
MIKIIIHIQFNQPNRVIRILRCSLFVQQRTGITVNLIVIPYVRGARSDSLVQRSLIRVQSHAS